MAVEAQSISHDFEANQPLERHYVGLSVLPVSLGSLEFLCVGVKGHPGGSEGIRIQLQKNNQ